MDQEFNLDKNEITIGKEKNEKKDILDENTIKEEISQKVKILIKLIQETATIQKSVKIIIVLLMEKKKIIFQIK